MLYFISVFVFITISCSSVQEKVEIETVYEEDTVKEAEVKEVEKEVKPKQYAGVKALAKGILTRMNGNWFYCGTKLSEEKSAEMAVAIAYLIYSNMDSVGLDVSPWGIVGTMFNESRIDACALGLHPRLWAYQNSFLLRKKTNISHTKKDVLKVVNSKEANKRFATFDLGICQVLTKFYPGMLAEDFVSLETGIRICILEMKARAYNYNTKRPWLYWRGKKTDWYGQKVRRHVKLMGAPKSVLQEI